MPENQTFGIIFQTTANSAGAKQVLGDIKDVTQAAKAAGLAGQEMGEGLADGSSKPGNPLKEMLAGLKSARLESKAFGEVLQGDFTNAAGMATTAVKGLNLAMRAGPMGLMVGAAAMLIPKLIAIFQPAKDAGNAVDGAGDKMETAAGKMDLAKEAAEKVKSAVEAIIEVMKQAATASDAWATKTEESIKANEKLALSEVKLREATGQITHEQAKLSEDWIKGRGESAEITAKMMAEQRKADEAAFAFSAAEKQDATARQKVGFAERLVGARKADMPQGDKDIDSQNFGAAEGRISGEFEKLQRQYRFGPSSEREETSKKMDALNEELAKIHALIAASKQLKQAQQDAATAEQVLHEASAKALSAQQEAHAKIGNLSKERQAALNNEAADELKVQQDSQKKALEEAKKKHAELHKDEKRQYEDAHPFVRDKPEKDTSSASDRRLSKEAFEIKSESSKLASDASRAHASSPEETARLNKAADALATATKDGDGANVHGALDRLASVVEKLADKHSSKSDQALGKQLETRIKSLENKVARMAKDSS